MEWSEIESIDGDEIEQKGAESGNKSGGIMTISCVKVDLMWGGNRG